MTRVTVPVGEDIGFLPGTEEEKMTPWMGALDGQSGGAGTRRKAANGAAPPPPICSAARSRFAHLNFMRGRTFQNKYLIIDEAQNLTAKQMKTLITRAGPGTKVICLGNIAQIDTPLPIRNHLRPDLCGGPLQGLATRRPCHLCGAASARGWRSSRPTGFNSWPRLTSSPTRR
jgi:predicted ribonuclease YlaK